MFSLIVTLQADAWERPQPFTFGISRFGEYSDAPWGEVGDGAHEQLATLNGTDALLVYERGVIEPHGELVRIGHLVDVRLEEGDVRFKFAEASTLTCDQLWQHRFQLDLVDFQFSRTHWCVRGGELPQALLAEATPTPRRYDVVLSFAGEDRDYVEAVNELLTARGVDTFYDKAEDVDLWGKNLQEHFASVYGGRARFCLMFVSRHYVQKMWTRHERRTALTHALGQSREYILPVRFDDTAVPGLLPSIAFQDARLQTPAELAAKVLAKLRV